MVKRALALSVPSNRLYHITRLFSNFLPFLLHIYFWLTFCDERTLRLIQGWD